VSAPLFVEPSTGLNDGLNGEQAVQFQPKGITKKLEVVHSLAKWKRAALAKYHFEVGEGLYADMNAIRKEENLSYYHSFYVDQWDWEKAIIKADRTDIFLEKTVKKIYQAIKDMENKIVSLFPQLKIKLPSEIKFVTSQELEDLYPELSPEQRETEFARKHHAFFVKQVGWPLKSGVVHFARAFDYDDWKLNGDLIVYDYISDKALELSSMGIRVDAKAILKQSKMTEEDLTRVSPFHKAILEETIPFSIGGGIGQSRLCLFLLEKLHIGEVQVSYWDESVYKKAKAKGIKLL
ncbi:aspartate--ammonia ligase, partial [Candidatus Mycoplasma pogonae]